MKSIALVAAAGQGTRFSHTAPKQFAVVGGQTVLEITLCNLGAAQSFDAVIVAADQGNLDRVEALADGLGLAIPIHVVAGGETRKDTLESLVQGAKAADNGSEDLLLTLVDANRPLTPPGTYQDCVARAQETGCCCPVIRLADGIGLLGRDDTLTQIDSSPGVVRVVTPESFSLRLYEDLPRELKSNEDLRGIAELFLAAGQPVATVKADFRSLKITFPEDWGFFLSLYGNSAQLLPSDGPSSLGIQH